MKTLYYHLNPATAATGDNPASQPTEAQFPIKQPTVATVGFFDGVHRGHRHLLEQVRQTAREHGAASLVVTFDTHPRQILDDKYQPPLLNTLDEKLLLLSKCGIDMAVVLHFDRQMASLSTHDFMKTVLKEQCGVTHLIVGYDNRFGSGRREGMSEYAAIGERLNIQVKAMQALQHNGQNISSSVVRRYLQQGEVEMAENCLGYQYSLAGIVESGEREGRKMGFPTANLRLEDERKLVPASGVYAVKVRLTGSVEMKHGMVNIGNRPTFGGNLRTIETHILQYDDDLYGQVLRIAFVHRIREEQKFDNPSQLAEQIQVDSKLVMQQFEKEFDEEHDL